MSTGKNEKNEKQVSLAGVVKTSPGKTESGAQPSKKKKNLRWILPVAALVLVAGLVIGGFALFGGTDGPALTATEMVEYVVTPDSVSDKVAYFALGVTGENSTDRLDVAAVLCVDRENGTASVVQMPVATYIGKDTGFAVSVLGDVWGNPTPETFCTSCRIRLKAEEIEDGKHKGCGALTKQYTGSASGDLIRVFNEQYGLPIDNFLVISRAGLVELIDRLGGMDFNLEKKLTLAGKAYEKGAQTLSGAAAVEYAILYNYDGTPKSDLQRMTRQRELFAGLLQRLGNSTLEELYSTDKNEAVSGVFGKLMLGKNPVRFNTTSFGKARLLGISESAAENVKLSLAMAEFAKAMGDLSLDKVTFSVLPGESVKEGTVTVYSVNRAQAQELFGKLMNPHSLTVEVTAPQLKENPANSDATTVSLDQVGVSQSGELTTTTTAKDTKTTMAGGATQP